MQAAQYCKNSVNFQNMEKLKQILNTSLIQAAQYTKILYKVSKQ
jgi:hypothetical protein